MTITLRLTPLQCALAVSVGLGLGSAVIVKADPELTFRWVAFWLHILALVVVLVPYARAQWRSGLATAPLDRRDLVTVLILLGLATISSFMFLEDYPLISVGDELRDGGIQGVGIANGSMRNIFDWGTYQGIGLIIPAITSFFLPIFGRSVLAFRVPAALVSCLDVLVLYLAVRMILGRSAAFWSAAVLIALPLHLFVTRTQLSLILNSFFTSVLLLSLWIWLKRRDVLSIAALGLIAGFAFNFQVAARVVGVLVVVLALAIAGWGLVRQPLTRAAMGCYVRQAATLVGFVLVGFGPRLLFTPLEVFLHSGAAAPTSKLQDPGLLQQDYLKSVVAVYYEAVVSMDQKLGPMPILTPVLAALFFLGFGYAYFVKRNVYTGTLMLLCVAMPFTHSAMTNLLNAAHRMAALLPIVAVFVGLGYAYLLEQVRWRSLRVVLAGLAGLYLLSRLQWFFVQQPLNAQVAVTDYVAARLAYFLADNTRPGQELGHPKLCLVISPGLGNALGTAHWGEAYGYFVPNVEITRRTDAAVQDTEVYVVGDTCPADVPAPSRTAAIACRPGRQLDCPRDFNGEVRIHY